MNRRSIVAILVALALMAIAATIRSGWLYLVSSALVALVIAGLISGWRTVRGIDIRRECPSEVFEGEPFQVNLRIRNNGRLGKHFLSIDDRQLTGPEERWSPFRSLAGRRAEYRASVDAGGRAARDVDGAVEPEPVRGSAAPITATIESLPRGESVVASYQLIAPRRGIHEEAELVLRCGGVFGVSQNKRTLRVASPITVYPEVSWLDSFPLGAAIAEMPAESREFSRKGVGLDFYGVREYAPGDSLRQVHWKSTARQGRLIVKEFQRELMPSPRLLLMLREPGHGDLNSNSLEDGLRAAASIINYCEVVGFLPQLIVGTEDSYEVVTQNSVQDHLRVLAAYEPGIGDGFGPVDSARLMGRVATDGQTLTVIVNLRLEEVAPYLEALGGIESTVVVIVDDSYGRRFSQRRADEAFDELGLIAAIRNVNLYLVTDGREIARCLSEPLNITGV